MGGITPVAGSEAGGSGAGEGGVAGASMHPANCDDGDPCTIDEAVAAGCDHRAVEDDTACDDGDVCTARDACQSGKCVGTFEETEGKLLGQLHAFGGFAPEHDGLALVLPGERAVFADPLNRGATRLTLVSTQGDALTVLDQIESPWPVIRTQISPWLWSNGFLSTLTNLGSDRIGFITSAGFEVYDLAGNELRLASSIIAAAGGRAAIAKGDQLWTCGQSIKRFKVSQDAQATIEDEGVLTGAPNCEALALSEDGALLYAATHHGLEVHETNADVTAEPKQTLFDEAAFFNVAAAPGHLVLQQMNAPGGLGEIMLLSTTDLAKVASLPYDPQAYEQNLGFALDGNSLIVQKLLAPPSGGTIESAQRYAIENDSLVPLESWTHRAHEHTEHNLLIDLTRPSLAGGLAILQPVRSSYRVAAEPGLVSSEQQGSFSALEPLASGQLLAFGLYSSQLIDVSDPQSPQFVAGGQTLGASAQPLKLIAPGGGVAHARLLNAATPGASNALSLALPGDTASLLRAELGQAARLSGSVAVRGGPAHLFTAMDVLYRLSLTGKTTFSLSASSLLGLDESDDQSLNDDFTSELEIPSPIHGSSRWFWRAAADDRGESLVLLDNWNTPEGRLESSLSWFALSDAGTRWIASTTISKGETDVEKAPATQLAVFDGRAVVSEGYGRCSIFRLQGEDIVTDATVELMAGPEKFSVRRVLRFDARFVYLAGSFLVTGQPARPAVVLLRSDDLTPAAHFDTEDDVDALTVVGAQLVFATANTLRTAQPQCEL